MKRYGSVVRIKPDRLEEYKTLHQNVWPKILQIIKDCNIQNYSIYYRDGLLFSYFEYTGDNYEIDMQKMADDPETQKWWVVCKPCQQPVETANVETANKDEWWAEMEEVFHLD